MERSTSSRISKAQRETHSEIERKRRERMKRDTEFLRKQLGSSQCKDKLSIFQVGAERLIQYTDKLGERDYIISDEEYSRIIMSQNFAGFSIHVRCSDSKILAVSANAVNILDLSRDQIVGSSIRDLAEPSPSTEQLINDVFQCSDFQWNVFNGVVSRNFILPLRCGPNVAACHCVPGTDGGRYRFIEFCGDLSHQDEESNSNELPVSFRGLCRPHDPPCSTVQYNPCTARAPSTKAEHFTLRLSPNSFRIIEVVGNCEQVLGCMANSLLRKPFRDVCSPSEQDSADHLLKEVLVRSPVTGSLHLIHNGSGEPVRFDIRLSAIRLGSYFHGIICRLNLPQFSQITDSNRIDADCNCFKSDIDYPPAVSPISSQVQKHLERRSPSKTFSVSGQQQVNQDIVDETTLENTLPDRTYSTEDLVKGTLPPSARSDPVDDWFKNVDTSSFQNLLNTDSY